MDQTTIRLAGLGLAAFIFSAGAQAAPLKDELPPLDPAFAALIRTADLAAGAAFFERKCSQCHDGQKEGGNFKGPHLWNVMGRMAASREGFRYSPAMKQVQRPWSYATLDAYLKNTEAAVPGREMNFTGIADDATRANLIAYLRTLHDAPLPDLPE